MTYEEKRKILQDALTKAGYTPEEVKALIKRLIGDPPA